MFFLHIQTQFNQMNAKDGTYLKKVFIEARYDTVKMYMSKNGGRRDIYLPKLGSKRATVIVYRNEDEYKPPVNTYFTYKKPWDPLVHIPGVGNIEIPTNTAWTFFNNKGKWTIANNETWTSSQITNITEDISTWFYKKSYKFF